MYAVFASFTIVMRESLWQNTFAAGDHRISGAPAVSMDTAVPRSVSPTLRSARALLFLHGNAGNASHRLPNAQLLNAMELNVLVLDYRGYGLSDGTATPEGVEIDARAGLAHLLDERGFAMERVFVFGRSLGGAVAIDLAQWQSERISFHQPKREPFCVAQRESVCVAFIFAKRLAVIFAKFLAFGITEFFAERVTIDEPKFKPERIAIGVPKQLAQRQSERVAVDKPVSIALEFTERVAINQPKFIAVRVTEFLAQCKSECESEQLAVQLS